MCVVGKHPETGVVPAHESVHISLVWELMSPVYSYKGLFCNLFPQLEMLAASGSVFTMVLYVVDNRY